MAKNSRVFVVEDDLLINLNLRSMCEKFGSAVLGYSASAEEAIPAMRDLAPTHVLMDVRLAGEMDGVDAALAVYKDLPETRFIYITGSSEPATLQRIESDHPYRVLIKPIGPEQLREALA